MKIKRLLYYFALFFFCLQGFTKPVKAISDPLAFPNNKVGIHILDPNEVEQVAELVNGNGGDWGHVTVPLRDDDRDRNKWQVFFARCKEHHLTPIIRIATVMTPEGWEEPNLYQSVDFANFLADLEWPTKNRYVIIYNEPNHASEWGGRLNPAGYARILKYTAQIFKVRSEDFFVLPAGFDAAAPDGGRHMSLYNFLSQMIWAEPDVFHYIDGWTSHAYPNPSFSGQPLETHSQSIASFRYELAYVNADKNLPVFITETGWRDDRIGEEKAAQFYKIAFANVWNDEVVVAVTPFLLDARDGPFVSFSFLKKDGARKLAYQVVKDLPKNKGEPSQSQPSKLAQVLGVNASVEKDRPTDSSNYHPTRLPEDKWGKIFQWFGIY